MHKELSKILVTGGAGFIGSHFIRYMLKKHEDCEIVNFDLLTYAGNPDNLKDVAQNPRYSFIQGDIRSREDVKSAMVKADYVVHFAAESHVDRSIEGPEEFVRTNVLGTQILLEYALGNKVKKFVHVSTDEVYGSLGPTGFFTEETPLAPNSPYSASKASSDLLAMAYYHTYGFPVVITRCSNNYGPYQYPEKLIPLMITNAFEDKPLPVYGDGMNVRDWLYVEDHCAAINLVLENGRAGQVYNIGGNDERYNIDIVKMILKDIGKPESLIAFVKDRLGHDRRYAINASKIQKELGWAPATSFDEGIKQTVKWYADNLQWIKAIKAKLQKSTLPQPIK